MGEAEGPDRAIDAVQKALDSPLLNDCDLTTAKGVLVNITSSKEDGGLTMAELSQIMDQVRSYTGGAFNKFKRGVVYDPSIGKKISVTIVATGFEISNLPQIDMDDDNDGPIPLEPGAIWDDEPEDTPEQEFAQPENTLKQVYVKPALVYMFWLFLYYLYTCTLFYPLSHHAQLPYSYFLADIVL